MHSALFGSGYDSKVVFSPLCQTRFGSSQPVAGWLASWPPPVLASCLPPPPPFDASWLPPVLASLCGWAPPPASFVVPPLSSPIVASSAEQPGDAPTTTNPN